LDALLLAVSADANDADIGGIFYTMTATTSEQANIVRSPTHGHYDIAFRATASAGCH